MKAFDLVGGVLSAACAVHCLAAPLILVAWWTHPAVHWALAACVVPLAGVVLWRGYRRHRARWVAIAAIFGAGLVVTGLVLPHECCGFGWPSIVTTAGSLSLIAAHVGNLRLCHCCRE